MSAVTARALRKRFGDREVLAGLDWTVPQGSVYGLLGRNGAGKTTLLALAMGLLLPDAGDIAVLGRSPSRGGAVRPRVAFLPDVSDLPQWARLADVIRLEERLRGGLSRKRLDRYLGQEQLDGRRAIKELSKGQLQRVAIELALAAEPEVLIGDEPLDGLDPVSRVEALEGLLELAARGATLVLSSHILADLERMCDRVGVLSRGRVLFEATLDEIKEDVRIVHREDGVRPDRGTIVGSRGDHTWMLRGVTPADARALADGGWEVRQPPLDELGVELIRCLEGGDE